MTIFRHLVSALSLSAITLNLTFWMIPLFAVSLTRTVAAGPRVREACDRYIEFIYRSAASFDSWWIARSLGVRLDIVGQPHQRRDRNLIILCNHRTWFDILVLHAVIQDYSPIVKFLIKRQLIYVPVLGWICLALRFPRLYRGETPEGRSLDYQAIANAVHRSDGHPTALLNFAEGTRFTPGKHAAQDSPYRHLLKPRAGGLRIMLDNTRDPDILDMTLAYPRELTFWRCLGGELEYVKVYLEYFRAGDIQDAAAWLSERWEIKDRLISEEFQKNGSDELH